MKTPSHRPPAQPTRILLIEDVAATTEIVSAYLRAGPRDVVVEAVGSLRAALAKLATCPFDLVVADLNLPDAAGLETLDRLVEATDRLVIVLTAADDPALKDEAIARGAYEFLHKSRMSQATLGQIVRLATVQARTFHALRESEARFRSLTELSADWYWEQDADLRFVSTAGLTDHRGGITPQAHIGKRRWELPNTAIVNQTWDEHRALLAARAPFRDLLLRRVDDRGEVHFVSVAGQAVFDAQGNFRGYRGVASDVTARVRAEDALRFANEQLAQLALQDPLTGLANRRKFAERFEYDMARAVRAGTPLSLLMVDIDHFKETNDRHGHLAGDACLTAVAALLTRSVRSVDLVARFGGEEFVILLPDMGAEASLLAAERMRALVEAEPIRAAGCEEPIALTVCIGAATATGSVSLSLDELLGRADAAAYRAKRLGRNRVCAEQARS